LFVAVFPPDEVVRSLRRVLPDDARLTAADKWHVTLVFLGEVEQTSDVAAVLGAVPTGGPFTLRLAGGGRFGSAAWAGVSGDLAALGALRESVRSALGHADPRPFQPHLTVSYHGDGGLLTTLSGYSGAEWTVAEFALVSSHDGVYEILRAWPL
jgi:2'-5' RNA ligase